MLFPTRWRAESGKGRSRGREVRPGVERLEEICLLSSAKPDMVLKWDSITNAAVAVDHSGGTPSQGGPTKTARAMASESVAVYDAVNAIHREATPYLLKGKAPRGASIDAAVAQAAHDTLVALYPNQKAAIDKALKRSLARVADGTAKAEGIATGKKAARLILKAREGDGSEIN